MTKPYTRPCSKAGFTGLELAPTRIFSEAPYENLTSALLFGGYLKNR